MAKQHGQVEGVTERDIIQGQTYAPHGAPYLLCAENLALGVAMARLMAPRASSTEAGSYELKRAFMLHRQ